MTIMFKLNYIVCF